MYSLLLVEDEPEIADAVRFGLEREGFDIDVASTGTEGLNLALTIEYSVILLDIMLPIMDGFEVCEAIRQAKIPTPILMLTARRHILDRVHGLDIGADDYLSKPFAVPELVARLHALIRRDLPNRNTVVEIGSLRIDTRMCRVLRNGQPVALTPREYRLIEALALRQGDVLSREAIAEEIWQDRDSTSNTVDVHIAQLRRKLEQPGDPKLIATIHGRGYSIPTTLKVTE